MWIWGIRGDICIPAVWYCKLDQCNVAIAHDLFQNGQFLMPAGFLGIILQF